MVYLLLADGFEESEALVTADMLRRGGVEVVLTGVTGQVVIGAHGIAVMADQTVDEAKDDGEMVVLPGGIPGVPNIAANEKAMALVKGAVARGAYVAAICAAPTILAGLGLLEGKKAVVYPGMEDEMAGAEIQLGSPVVMDGMFITGEAAGSAFDFGLKLVEILKGAETAQRVKNGVHYRQ